MRYPGCLSGFVFLQQGHDTLIIVPRRIDSIEDMLVTTDELIIVHLGDEINGEIRIVPRPVIYQAIFLFQTLVKFCSWRGIKQADHGRYDSGFLDKINLVFKD